MNWDAIKYIYKNVLGEEAKIEYIGEDKYKIIKFYLSGKKRTQIEYNNGITHGKGLGWYEDGSKHWEAEYKNAKLHGRYRIWLLNGSLSHDAKYKNGILIKYKYTDNLNLIPSKKMMAAAQKF